MKDLSEITFYVDGESDYLSSTDLDNLIKRIRQKVGELVSDVSNEVFEDMSTDDGYIRILLNKLLFHAIKVCINFSTKSKTACISVMFSLPRYKFYTDEKVSRFHSAEERELKQYTHHSLVRFLSNTILDYQLNHLHIIY